MEGRIHVKLGRFGCLPLLLLKDRRIKPNALRVYIAVQSYEGIENNSGPSQEQIADRAGIPRDGVRAAIGNLVKTGWLQRRRRGMGMTDQYECLTYTEPAEEFEQPRRGNPENFQTQEELQGQEGLRCHSQEGLQGQESAIVPASFNEDRPPLEEDHPERPPSRSAAARAEYSESFECFWQVYPRRIAKKAAYGKWVARLGEGISGDDLLAAARVYAQECDAEGRPEKFIKQPETFLGPNERWKDYLPGNGRAVSLDEAAMALFSGG